MQIHYGIRNGRDILWPKRCLWCGGKPEKWQRYRKRSVYNIEYRIFWINISSRVQTIFYPLCKKHNILAHILRPSRLLCASIIMLILIIGLQKPWLNLFFLIMVAGYFYYKKYGLIVHNVGEELLEISLPAGRYADEFSLLSKTKGSPST